jgi:catechol 2,3-dioxygenase-like lactoylglutathione lyase family enzyme
MNLHHLAAGTGAARWFVGAFLLVVLLVASPQGAFAQDVSLVGVDHVGINVPDLDQAVRFFSDVLGCTPVTEIGPLPLDSAWKERYRIRQSAEVKRIVALRAGNGSNIELFQFDAPEGSKEQPFGDDIGATHIAFYTSNMQASVAALRVKGVHFLNDPIVITTGPTAGETWVYFLTPWGSKIELVSYPKGKAYEKAHPAVSLWSPDGTAHAAPAEGLGESASGSVKAIVGAYFEAWSEPDSQKRLRMIDRIYTTRVRVIDPAVVTSGRTSLNDLISKIQREHPGFRFALAGPIESHHGVVRLYWNFGPLANPHAVSGQDIITIHNGRISTLIVFLNEVTP